MKEITPPKKLPRKRAKYVGKHPHLVKTEGYVKPNKSQMYLYLPDGIGEWYRVSKDNLSFIIW